MPPPPFMLQGKKQQMSPQARQFLAGQVKQIGDQALSGRQSQQAAYQGRLAVWRENMARDKARRRKPKKKEEDKKVLGLF